MRSEGTRLTSKPTSTLLLTGEITHDTKESFCRSAYISLVTFIHQSFTLKCQRATAEAPWLEESFSTSSNHGADRTEWRQLYVSHGEHKDTWQRSQASSRLGRWTQTLKFHFSPPQTKKIQGLKKLKPGCRGAGWEETDQTHGQGEGKIKIQKYIFRFKFIYIYIYIYLRGIGPQKNKTSKVSK